METSESTIKDYRSLAIAKYGFEILEQKVDDESGLPEYEEQDEKCGAFNVAVMENYMLVHIKGESWECSSSKWSPVPRG